MSKRVEEMTIIEAYEEQDEVDEKDPFKSFERRRELSETKNQQNAYLFSN